MSAIGSSHPKKCQLQKYWNTILQRRRGNQHDNFGMWELDKTTRAVANDDDAENTPHSFWTDKTYEADKHSEMIFYIEYKYLCLKKPNIVTGKSSLLSA